MKEDIRRTIRNFYKGDTYTNPIDSENFEIDKRHQRSVYELIGDLRSVFERENVIHGADENYDLSELVIIKDKVLLRISFLGPYAHLNTEEAKKHFARQEMHFIKNRIKEVLDKYMFFLLSDREVNEEVAWLKKGDSLVGEKVTVWNCLFCEY